MITIEITKAELLGSLAQQAAEHGVKNGAIISLIGVVDSFTVSTMSAKDVITEYALPAEMSGTGEIVNGEVHVHAVMAVEGDRAISGHLHQARVGTWFARAYVLPRL